jgi:hypothetical protein
MDDFSLINQKNVLTWHRTCRRVSGVSLKKNKKKGDTADVQVLPAFLGRITRVGTPVWRTPSPAAHLQQLFLLSPARPSIKPGGVIMSKQPPSNLHAIAARFRHYMIGKQQSPRSEPLVIPPPNLSSISTSTEQQSPPPSGEQRAGIAQAGSMATTGLIHEAALLEWTGFRQRSRLERWLVEKNIPYDKGRGGAILTTLAAINQAFLDQPSNDDEFEFVG